MRAEELATISSCLGEPEASASYLLNNFQVALLSGCGGGERHEKTFLYNPNKHVSLTYKCLTKL